MKKILQIKIFTKESTFGQIPAKELAFMRKYSFPTFIYVYDPLDSKQHIYNELLELESKDLKHEIFMYNSTMEAEETKDLISLFRIKKNELPVMLIYNNKMDEVIKHKKIKEKYKNVTKEDVKIFVDEFKNHLLERFFKSEEIPKDNKSYNTTVQNLVGLTLNSFINLKNKDHIIFFVKRTDPYYPRLHKMIERVGQKIFPNNERIVIGEIDISLNEFDWIGIDSLPAMVLLKDEGDKMENIKNFHDNFTIEEMIKFIIANAKNKIHNLAKFENEFSVVGYFQSKTLLANVQTLILFFFCLLLLSQNGYNTAHL